MSDEARFEAKVTVTMIYHIAVDAVDAITAQQAALQALNGKDPVQATVECEVMRGVL